MYSLSTPEVRRYVSGTLCIYIIQSGYNIWYSLRLLITESARTVGYNLRCTRDSAQLVIRRMWIDYAR